jgi:2-phospho-L-lactate guanylyltransferase
MAEGKSRLAAVLEPPARARLNRRLLAHTLGVTARWYGDLSRCVVVSPCPEARAAAARLGAHVVAEAAGAAGLNAAAALGAARAFEHGALSILVLACDLPCLTADSLAALADCAGPAANMVIAPDRSGAGTNAILVSAQPPFEFRFGERSCARHLALAAERGWQASLCRRAELEFDLDTPEDLVAWEQEWLSGSERRGMSVGE